ncbi:MAG: UbiA prenyltransferase [Akkermansiaceae bacterium]|nr:UbiA prenyltransferase [Akkermansiaceae bacterium]
MNPPAPTGKWHAFLTTARLPNVPSVISNVWMGVALGALVWDLEGGRSLFLKALAMAVSGVLLYFGGNFLNDWQDREWDEKHRPERALPQKLFSPLNYLLNALRFLGLGVVCSAVGGPLCIATAVVIVIAIFIYTKWHKVAVWPVIPMGLCRALLPVLGFLAMKPVGPQLTTISLQNIGASAADTPLSQAIFIGIHALGLFGWIAGLTLNARYESIGDPPAGARFFARLLLAMPLILIGGRWLLWYPIPAVIGMVPLLYWMWLTLAKKRNIGQRVSMLLAGIPLVEWVAAMPLAIALRHPSQSLLGDPLTGLTLLLPPTAFLVARRLQRRIAAT